MLNTPRIAQLIQQGELESIASTIEMGQQDGMQSLDQAIYDLYKRGLIKHDDALKFADSANNVRIMMRGLSYTTTR
jgi:twitching motility protein PilU